MGVMLAVAVLAIPCASVGAPEGATEIQNAFELETVGTLTIIRPDDDAIIGYSSFDITAEEVVRFEQLSVDSRVLNRVQSANPTEILGHLEANGHVYIVNPAGVTFGPNATVTAAGLNVAAGTLSAQNFNDHIDNFTNLEGNVVNRGAIDRCRTD